MIAEHIDARFPPAKKGTRTKQLKFEPSQEFRQELKRNGLTEEFFSWLCQRIPNSHFVGHDEALLGLKMFQFMEGLYNEPTCAEETLSSYYSDDHNTGIVAPNPFFVATKDRVILQARDIRIIESMGPNGGKGGDGFCSDDEGGEDLTAKSNSINNISRTISGQSTRIGRF